MKKILIVEDDLTFSRILKGFLEKNQFVADAVDTVEKARQNLANHSYDMVITDYRLPDDTGMSVLRYVKQTLPSAQVILMTRYSDINTAIHSMKLGALDYLVKPVNPDELLHSIKSAFQDRAGEDNGTATHKNMDENTIPSTGSVDYVVGSSKPAREMQRQIELVAPTDMSVILTGDSGTGKEYAAKLMHNLSSRKDKAFIALDCGALSRELAASELFGHVKGAFTGAVMNKTGQFEMANMGTIFLDEIGNLSYEVQIQLLRAIQERKIKKLGDTRDIDIDVRIIAATNEDLKIQVEKGLFREDLYHRINEFKIQVPSLKDRDEDIMEFAAFFLSQANEQLNKRVQGFDPEVLRIFLSYSWPGNIREFKNIVKRAVLLCEGAQINKLCIPDELFESANLMINSTNLKEIQKESEKEIIVKTLEKNRYNKSKTARMLNIDRKTLYMKIEKYGIDC
ncbi:MAG: sigma-54-dependent Fis family transcriptional regulator [Cyclobacteriaceae bacterium]|nr:sigma-54-dependent Fis family transcriptional regulator [Cyclobacteriaceae bacterium]